MKHYINLAVCDRLRDGETIQLINLSNENIIAEFTQNDIDIANNAKKYHILCIVIDKSIVRNDYIATTKLLSRLVDTISKHCYVHSEINLY